MGGRAGGSGSGFGSRSGGGGLQRSLASIESSIRGMPFENSAIIDNNGNIIERNLGERKRVGYDAILAIGKTVTHNHPSGASFSQKDIMGAVQSNLSEIRVVTKGYTYSMKPGKNGWGVDNSGQKGVLLNGLRFNGARLKPTSQMQKVQKAYSAASAKVEKAIKGSSNPSRYQSIKVHLINKEFAKTMGYTYTKTKVK